MKVYTKTGDKGSTSLYGGTRVAKHHIRIDAYGTVDELNSYLGMVRDQNIDQLYKEQIIAIQHHLFTVGAQLATPQDKEQLKSGKDRLNIDKISDDQISFLERAIDEMDRSIPAMTHFVLPGGHPAVSFCHIARCVCRRAERIISALSEEENIDENVLRYVNRLSDYIFTLGRRAAQQLEVDEVKWVPKKY